MLGGLAVDETARRALTAGRPQAGSAERFAADTNGAVAVVFAIVFATVLMALAIALDFGRGSAEANRQQWALDAAALAASDQLGLPEQDERGEQVAEAYFEANMRPGSDSQLTGVTLDEQAGSVVASATGGVVTTLMRAFGYKDMRVGAKTTVVKGGNSIELALVLDNSGSMKGSYIDDLKTATQNLLGALFAGADGTDKVRVGVVPFAASVNVGSAMRGESWIDNAGIAPTHMENVSESRTRFQLFDDIGVNWRGCVEVRPGVHAYSDSLPDDTTPATLFVPMFAPDEPDNDNDGGQSFSNSYLTDDEGACVRQPTVCTKYNWRGRCTRWSKVPLDPAVAQARTCKYDGQLPSGGSGPNQNCSTLEVLPLSNNQSIVEGHVNAMTAGGYTNIGEGFMWGWRLLSPAEPFIEGKPYAEAGNQKIIILMTDGQNTYRDESNMNKSHYNAYGFASKGRLGTNYSEKNYRAVMNSNLTQACGLAKQQGITVYTIAFRLENDSSTTSLLTSCATGSGYFFAASNGQTLVSAFQEIAKQLSKLRVAS